MRFILLLRGINVGGHNRLNMRELCSALTSQLDYTDVQYYIQSGNLAFNADHKSEQVHVQAIKTLLQQTFNLSVPVLVFSQQWVIDCLTHCPFRTIAEEDPKTVHLFFLDKPISEDAATAIANRLQGSESIKVSDKVVYLCTPDGFRNTKLSNDLIEKAGACIATARNWNTSLKLGEL